MAFILLGIALSQATVLAKTRAKSQRTCFQPATAAVSDLLCSSCTREPCHLISFVAFTIDPLANGYTYGPTLTTDLCVCSTVAYNLLSACDGCQGDTWNTYDTPRCPPFKFLGSYIWRQLCDIYSQLLTDFDSREVSSPFPQRIHCV